MGRRADLSDRAIRLAAAASVAPIFGASLTAFGYAFIESPQLTISLLAFAAVAGGYFGFVIGLPAMVLVGLPVHAALMAAHIRSVLAYIPAGAATGAISAICYGIVSVGEPYSLLTLGAATGAICASVFWLIRRPDRDVPNPDTRAP